MPAVLLVLVSVGAVLGQTSDSQPRPDTLRLGDVEVTGGATPVLSRPAIARLS